VDFCPGQPRYGEGCRNRVGVVRFGGELGAVVQRPRLLKPNPPNTTNKTTIRMIHPVVLMTSPSLFTSHRQPTIFEAQPPVRTPLNTDDTVVDSASCRVSLVTSAILVI